MKKILWLVILILLTPVLLSGQTQIKTVNIERFEDVFEKIGVIPLDFGEILIGHIDEACVAPNGNFLLIDRQNSEVFLADINGKLIKKIDIQKDIPGYLLSPQTAAFSSDNGFIIYNAPMSFLFFNAGGDFIRRQRLGKSHYFKSICGGPDGCLYAYTVGHEKIYVTKMDSTGQTVMTGGVYPEKHFHFIDRVGSGGQIYWDGMNRLYQTHATTPDLVVYNSSLELTECIKPKPAFFKALPEKDDKIFENAANMATAFEIMGEITLNLNLLPLTRDTLLMQYLLPRGSKERFALILYSKKGDLTVFKSLHYKKRLLTAGNGCVYTMREADDETYLVPALIAYRLRPAAH